MPPLDTDSPDLPRRSRAGADGSATEGKRYWRSLDRLLDSPGVRAELEAAGISDGREFPYGASEAPDAMSRRTLLTVMGASFALAGLTGCRRPVEHIVPYVEPPERVVPGIARRYATTLPFGTEALGAVVESHEGRPTKIEGNELHPASGGAASAWMQASILGLYDPDRLRQPARQPPGSAEARPAAWKFFEAFWQERVAELEPAGGAGLAILATGYSSPTLARLRAAFEARFPEARWVTWEPVGDGDVFRGLEAATGTPCRPVYHLERAKVIAALDADLLLTESGSLAAARGFARGRKVTGPEDSMNRLYAVESHLSITGSMADHRLRLQSRRIPAFAAALATELGVAVPGGFGELPEAARAKAKVIAADLRAAGADALVVAGRHQPPAVHALVLAIHRALGAVGRTVTLHPLQDAEAGDAAALGELVAAMNAGEVSTLISIGGNPSYDAPADLDLATALGQVAHTAHLSGHRDETARLVQWQLAESHPLEAWGDARAADGTPSVVQPLIAPLHESRSAVELLGLLVHDEHRPGYELVRESWRSILGEGDFEEQWRRVLHDGLLADGAAAPIDLANVGGAEVNVPAPEELPATDGMELTFHPDASVYDGRFANNGWLQELPDTLTKLTWDNAALLSPATAEEVGVASGDRVRLRCGDRSLEAPVFVLPGQADGSVALALGYGRTSAGRVGDGVGFDAYALRATGGLGVCGGVTVERVGGAYPLAQTQEHWSMEGRELIREATLDEYRENPGFVGPGLDPEHSHQLFPDHDYEDSPQWGMAIDLNACIGCNACIVACQSENNVPIVGKEQVSRGREMQWLRVDRYFSGGPEEPEVVFQPVPCMHCENAPCEQVCPVAATVHDGEGINTMVYNRCIGTRYCSNNCPYKVRRFNFFNYTKDTPELVAMAMNPDVTVRSRGVMEKCTYCLQRISEAKIAAKVEDRPLADGDVRTACQETCPAEAIAFGDVRDPESEVSRWKELDRDYVLLGELNNRPRTSYLAKLRNPNPQWESA